MTDTPQTGLPCIAVPRAEMEEVRETIANYLSEHDTPAPDYAYRARCRDRLRTALAKLTERLS